MGYVPEGAPLIDEVPPRVRVGLGHILGDHLSIFQYARWDDLYAELLRASRRPRGSGSGEVRVLDFLAKVPWLEIYEIVEHMAAKMKDHDRTAYRDSNDHFVTFRRSVNELFDQESTGYLLDNEGKVQLRLSTEMVEAVTAALGTTERGPYAASAEQLRRALEKLSFRKMDPTNAVKDAVGALEGVVRVRLNSKGDIGDLSPKLRVLLHPTLAGAVDALVKVEAYRGAEAAHADKPGRAVTVEEAIFVVHVCSAAIALIASHADEARAS
jgi:hypothetical protein